MASRSNDINILPAAQGKEPDSEPLRPLDLKRKGAQYTHAEVARFQSRRKGFKQLIEWLPNQSEREKAAKEMLTRSFECEDEEIALRLNYEKELAGVLFNEGKYAEAVKGYKRAISGVSCVQKKPDLLLQEFYNENYLEALKTRPSTYQMKIFFDLVSCCNNVALACIKLKLIPQAIDWLQEIEVLYECLRYSLIGVNTKPQVLRIPFIEFASYRMKAALRYINICMQLRNTGAAGFYAWRIAVYSCWFPTDIPEIKTINDQCNYDRILSFRHPEPKNVDTWSVECPELQLRGIWSKIRMPVNARPTDFPVPNSWIWRSRLYVLWGTGENNKLYYLDLKDTKIWHRSVPFPKRFLTVKPSLAKPLVYEDRVWFFAGQMEILRFDMVSEKWDSIHTSFNGEWLFNTSKFVVNDVCIYSVERYRNKMCVFGGLKDQNSLFMLLDLTTFTWRCFDLARRLSGKTMQHLPVGRSGGITWVVEDEDKYFIMYGDIDAEDYDRSPVHKEPFVDLWSFSFRTEKWTRERVRGNCPSPRVAMSHTYHNGLKKLVAFGGVTDRAPTGLDGGGKFNEEIDYPLTYYADTFVMDMESYSWQQIVTRNFPAWRCNSRMLIDEADGRIYIYGGLSHELPVFGPGLAKTPEEYSFRDIWLLDLDLPGQHFDVRKFERITPFKVGCFRRCFSCLKIGSGYFRCQGTCGGRSIYCSSNCQRKAWKHHQTIYRCRK